MAAKAIMPYSAASKTPVNVTRAATLDVAVSTAPMTPMKAVATQGVLNCGEMAMNHSLTTPGHALSRPEL
jgi:hypothetical protein